VEITDELLRNIQHSVWEWLGVLSDLGAQRRYEQDVPIAYHSAELFIAWRDAFIPESTATVQAFSAQQFQALQRFSAILEEVEDQIAPATEPWPKSRPYPPLSQLHAHPAWRRVVAAAHEARLVLTPCRCQLCERRPGNKGAV